MSTDKIVLVWSIKDGHAYISYSLSTQPLVEQYEWEGIGFTTPLAAVKAAKAAGIPVTHRVESDRNDMLRMPPLSV